MTYVVNNYYHSTSKSMPSHQRSNSMIQINSIKSHMFLKFTTQQINDIFIYNVIVYLQYLQFSAT